MIRDQADSSKETLKSIGVPAPFGRFGLILNKAENENRDMRILSKDLGLNTNTASGEYVTSHSRNDKKLFAASAQSGHTNSVTANKNGPHDTGEVTKSARGIRPLNLGQSTERQ